MQKVLILNGHQPYPFAEGRLNASLVERARRFFEANGAEVKIDTLSEGWDVDASVEAHVWADTIIMQFPVNWMGTPWIFKKYMDEVYTAGMDGRLCAGDGRTKEQPKVNYGMGGALTGTRYMLSVTLNAPAEAFDDPKEPFFEGGSLDDLLRPTHLNAKFFGLSPLPTFGAFDVMKNPDVENDFIRFDEHLHSTFKA